MVEKLYLLKEKLPTIIALFTVLAGVCIMFAWLFNVEFLKNLAQGSITIKFTTALCFVFAGIILLSIIRHFAQPSDVTEMIILFMSLAIVLLMGTILIAGFFKIQ